jgi:SAM-dependent methyltransferase
MAWLDARPGERILDVGCGRGVAIAYVADRVGPNGLAVGVERLPGYFQPLGADVSDNQAAVPLGVCADARELPLADGTFDALLCINVLEAIPDRAGALAEMRRVLKPGGRILVAHDDYESMVFAGADRDLTRQAVLAYSRAKFKSYLTSDGQMGRHLWGIFANSGFVDTQLRVVPLVNTTYREPLHGWTLSRFSAEFVAEVSDLTQPEIDRWHDELAAADARGDYLYCLNLYVCLGWKPDPPVT